MSSRTRQFNSLMRKNFISWKRRAKCSFTEICCPAFVMLIMVFLRYQIAPEDKSFDMTTTLKDRKPTFTAFQYEGDLTDDPTDSAWSGVKSTATVSFDLNGFMKYAEYPSADFYEKHNLYELAEDTKSPLFFIPFQCIKENSYVQPRVASPVIAHIGWNKPTAMMVEYLQKLIDFQKTNIDKIKRLAPSYPDFVFRNFTSKEELFDYTSSEDYPLADGNPGVCYGFQIEKDETTDTWQLELFFNDQQSLGGPNSIGIPNTQKPAYNPLTTAPDTTGFKDYLGRGYETLHNLAANIILKLETQNKSAHISLLSAPFTSDEVQTDKSFTETVEGVLPFMMLLILIPPVYNTVYLIVRERESRIKESMRMMGMRDTSYWLSWYVYYTVITTIIVILAWGVLMINVINFSNPFLIFAFMFMYAQAIFPQILFITMFLESSKYSNIIGALIYFAFNLLGLPVQRPIASPTAKTALSIIPQVAMQQLCGVFATLEGNTQGLNFDNASDEVYNYSYTKGIVMLALSIALFTLLAFYLDKVLPRQYGERLPICFCFYPKHVCCCCESDGDGVAHGANVFDEAGGNFEVRHIEDETNYEAVSPEIAQLEQANQCLRIEDLTKTYDGDVQAVDGLNIKMYSGQIFALLGHNGAGKSTTISMLTGLTQKTGGNAQVFGNDLFNQMSKVRDFMGVCPQHDVLFDNLTPEEHLSIFYDFKGGNPGTKEEELRSLIVDVGISSDSTKEAITLSGGNKRKLSVAIALCGNSRLVMLDEPTAGMDLSARRALWDMLKNYRNDRIIILTTHYMDEADVLGDRIGIMNAGKIKCLGSSLFLKNRFGAGYKLTMVKSSKQKNTMLESYLESFFGEVEKLSEVSSEITFKIDYSQVSKFEQFFADFDTKLESLDVLSYGISMTTLEEVFLSVNGYTADKGEPMSKQRRTSSINDDGMEDNRRLLNSQNKKDVFGEHSMETKNQRDNLSGHATLSGSVGALLTKRFNLYKRDICGLVCELIVPVLLALIGLCLLKVPVITDSPAFTLGTNAFPGPQRVLFNQDLVSPSIKASNDLTPKQLAEGLPDYATYFDVTYNSTASNYTEYYSAVNEQKTVGDASPYRFGSYQIYKASSKSNDFQINMFVNATSSESVPYFAQYIYQSIFANQVPDIKFEVTTAPFPQFYVFKQKVAAVQALDFSAFLAIALAIIPCVIISLIIKERNQQLKHMQMISGVSLPAYWISNMISDIAQAYIPILIIVLLQYLFSLDYEGVWVLLLLYPIAIVPFTYVTSFMFAKDTVAVITTVFVHFMVGGIFPATLFVLENIPYTANLADSMRWWFTFVPTFCVGEGIVFSSTYNLLAIARKGLKLAGFDVNQVNTDVWALTNLGGNMVIMAVTGVVCCLLLVFIEADIFQKCAKFTFRTMPEAKQTKDLYLDDDVLAEEERVGVQAQKARRSTVGNDSLLQSDSENQRSGESDVIRVANFRKVYTTMFGEPSLAVERLSFGLDYGECFALLGVNGAGKSTTFKSLTRDIIATDGDISIGGYSVTDKFSDARRLIGYCPQEDAIFPLMTVHEHLLFYARIKGVPVDLTDTVVDDIMTQFSLTDQKDKPAGTLSGGNKRKLQVAIAIVGSPPIILLDEPSAGMDPEARRFMWNVIENISQRDKKSAVVLTSHSMEEAEALSTKMGIMAKGGIFSCYGSSQHIKNKFSTGYEIQVKIRKPSYQELEQFKTTLNLIGKLSDRVSLVRVTQNISRSVLDPIIIEQIRIGGLGSSLAIEAAAYDGEVRMASLVHFLFTQQNGFKLVKSLAAQYAQVEILEQCGDFFKLRIPKDGQSIGNLFGHLEQQKEPLNIQEYAVSQTSLEQIFQTFAAQQATKKKGVLTFSVNAQGQLKIDDETMKSAYQIGVGRIGGSEKLLSGRQSGKE